jgi:hypothetical protein
MSDDLLTATITDRDKLRCIERELAMRRSLYPKWVGSGKMTAAVAERETAIMAAIAEDYRVRLNGCH